MTDPADPRVIATERILHATPAEIFAAFERPELLAKWWGPEGFTSTFDVFEFKPGGRWAFTMHAPNGAAFANVNIFQVIEPNTRLVIRHDVNPLFTLTFTLTPREGGTHMAWTSLFDSAEVANAIRSFASAGAEQTIDRLEAVLAGGTP